MKSSPEDEQSISLNRNQVWEVTKRLDAIIRLMALSLPTEMKQQEKIELLSRSGFLQREIASILGTTPGTVNTALQRSKKKAPR
jgi:DNA-directed RNA polymerase specialized sigma24 family protein